MSEQPLQIMSVNVHRWNVVQHGLLQKLPYDIILVQEPWFRRINVQRTDDDPAPFFYFNHHHWAKGYDFLSPRSQPPPC